MKVNAKTSRPFWPRSLISVLAYKLTGQPANTIRCIWRRILILNIRIWNSFSARLKIRQIEKERNYNFGTALTQYWNFGVLPINHILISQPVGMCVKTGRFMKKRRWVSDKGRMGKTSEALCGICWLVKGLVFDEISSWFYMNTRLMRIRKAVASAAEFFKYYKSWYFQVMKLCRGSSWIRAL